MQHSRHPLDDAAQGTPDMYLVGRMELGFEWESVFRFLFLDLKRKEGIQEEMICVGSAAVSAGRSQLILLFVLHVFAAFANPSRPK